LLTCGCEFFIGNVYDNCGRLASGILRAAGQVSAGDEVVDALFISSQVVCMGCWVDGWMGFVILSPIPRCLESIPIFQSGEEISQQLGGGNDVRLGEQGHYLVAKSPH
jgi:hypothetical protein